MVEARPVASEAELEQILELQQSNLARNLDEQERAEQGFVTVEHTLDVLRRMHAIVPSIVAQDDQELAGYALVLRVECSSFVLVRDPVFRRLDANAWLEGLGHDVMGEVRGEKPQRGRGGFSAFYAAHREN